MPTLKRVLLSLDVALFLAVKNILHKKKMLFLIVAIIGLGYLSATFSSSVIYGLQYTMEDLLIFGSTGHVTIEPKSDEEYLLNADEIVKKALSIPNVLAASSRMTTTMTIIDKFGTSSGVEVRIIDPEDEAAATNLGTSIIAGDYLSKGTVGEFIIGRDRTTKYGVVDALPTVDIDSGEMVTILFENGVQKKMKVRGIYSYGFAMTDIFGYITKQEAKQVFGFTDEEVNRASEIVILNSDRGYEEQVKYALQAQGVSGSIWKWPEKLGLLYQFIGSLMVISKLTALIGIIIAFASIYIIIYINVLQKRTQIGMLKAMGINSETILVSYVIQSFFYGVVGAVFGTILTLVVTDYLTMRPLIMPVGEVVPIISIATLVSSSLLLILSSILAGFIAAQGVVKDNILDAIFRG